MKNLFTLTAILLFCLIQLSEAALSLPKAAAQIATLLERAGSEYQSANYLSAIDLYKRALSQDNGNPSIHFGLGASYLASENYNLAIEHLLRALELNPALTEAYFSLAYTYQALGKGKEALTAYRQGLGFDLNKKLPRSKFWNEVVISSSNEDDTGSTDEDYQDAQAATLLPPEHKSPINQRKRGLRQDEKRVSLVFDRSHYEHQIEEVKAELESHPDDVLLKYKLALLYLKIKDVTAVEAIQTEIADKNEKLSKDLKTRLEKFQKIQP